MLNVLKISNARAADVIYGLRHLIHSCGLIHVSDVDSLSFNQSLDNDWLLYNGHDCYLERCSFHARLSQLQEQFSWPASPDVGYSSFMSESSGSVFIVLMILPYWLSPDALILMASGRGGLHLSLICGLPWVSLTVFSFFLFLLFCLLPSPPFAFSCPAVSGGVVRSRLLLYCIDSLSGRRATSDIFLNVENTRLG